MTPGRGTAGPRAVGKDRCGFQGQVCGHRGQQPRQEGEHGVLKQLWGAQRELVLEEGANQREDKRSECGGKRGVCPQRGQAGWRPGGGGQAPRHPPCPGLGGSGNRASCLRFQFPGSRARPADPAPGFRPRLLASSSREWREKLPPGVSSQEDTNPLVGAPPSRPRGLPKAPPPDTSHWGLGFNTGIWGTHSACVSLCLSDLCLTAPQGVLCDPWFPGL